MPGRIPSWFAWERHRVWRGHCRWNSGLRDGQLRPAQSHGVAKLAQTNAALAFSEATGTPVLIARIFNPIGPDMPAHLALGNFARQLAALRTPHGTLQSGNINVFRDFIDIDHVVTMLWDLAHNSAARGAVKHLAAAKRRESRKLVEILIDVSGKKITIETISSRLRPGELGVVVGSTALLGRLGAAATENRLSRRGCTRMEGSRGAFRRRIMTANDRAHLKPPREEAAVRSSAGGDAIVIDWGARHAGGSSPPFGEARFAATADQSGEAEHARVEDGRSTHSRPVATDDDGTSPQPLGQAATVSGSPGGRIKRVQKSHERPLAEMLSISAWRSFVPETIALLVVISLVRAAVPGGPAALRQHAASLLDPGPAGCRAKYGVMGGLFATLAAIGASPSPSGLPVQSAT